MSVALPGGQGLQRPGGQARVPGQQHPGGQQRVPAEQGHEPGRAGRHHRPRGVLGVEDAQRAEVLDAAVEHRGQGRVGGAHLRARGGATCAAAWPGWPARSSCRAGSAASSARRRLTGTASMLTVRSPWPGMVSRQVSDPSVTDRIAVAVDDQLLVAVAAAAGDHQRSSPPRARWPPPRLGPPLDLEQVGEVGVGGQLQGAPDGAGRGVAQGDVLAHAVADVAAAHHQQRAVGPARPRRHAAQERWPRTARRARPTAAGAPCRPP